MPGSSSQKKKLARGGKGLEQKKGAKGIAANYITRNQAIKKLQVSLKDFRRLCILKGIFPRDPSRKRDGQDKTYYHIKDIQYLSHEPLLAKFRELKTFLKKYKNALAKNDSERVKNLENAKPSLNVDHLIRERFPTFNHALNELDDALSMIFLFSALPPNPTKDAHQFDSVRANKVYRLAQEWQAYNIHAHTLRYVFVSIKGYYFQSLISNVEITWLCPHNFTQYLPDDVDYRVMLTFLHFYENLLKFVHFKLFTEENLIYPPNIEESDKDFFQTSNSVIIQHKDSNTTHVTSSHDKKDTKTEKAMQAQVNAIVKKLKNNKNAEESDEDHINDNDDSQNNQDKSQDFSDVQGQDQDSSSKIPTLFAGLCFLLSREIPKGPVEFVIRCAGGTVLYEGHQQINSKVITHHVIDRPDFFSKNERSLTREYIQPQWIFDSFNNRFKLPIKPYEPGQPLPPHLSPFVDNQKQGYIPNQVNVINSWINQNNQNNGSNEATEYQLKDQEKDKEALDNNDDDIILDTDDLEVTSNRLAEAEYEQEKLNEKQKQKNQIQTEDDQTNNQNDNNNNNLNVSKQSQQRILEKKVNESLESEKNLAIGMMGKKAKRLYQRIKFGINEKQKQIQTLENKRRKIDNA